MKGDRKHPLAARDDDALVESMFRQHKPCSDCPFRKEGGVRHEAQALEYAAYFTTYPGATFPCHQSVPKDDTRQKWSAWREGQTLCAGGLIFAEKLHRQNAIMRYGAAQGWYDPSKLIEREAIFDSLDELVAATKERE